MQFPRLFWAVIAALATIDYVWVRAAGITLTFNDDLVVLFFSSSAYLICRKFKLPRIGAFALVVSQLVAILSTGAVLSYLAATLNFPLIDVQLAAADRLLGFNWLTMFNWVKAHPAVDRLLFLSYWSSFFQLLLIAIILSAAGRFDRLRELVLLFGGCLFVVIAASAIFPAAGAWDFYGVSDRVASYYANDFQGLRAGTMTSIDLKKVTGIVQFPSFHAAAGLIFIIVTRSIYVVGPLAICLNVLMIISALTHGGHHLSDVVAGLAVALLVWRILPVEQRSNMDQPIWKSQRA
jgi:membrane-associated phospholipid phosphatase